MKALVAGDANLTILPRKVSINVTRLINMQLITTHLSIKIKQLPEVFSHLFFLSSLFAGKENLWDQGEGQAEYPSLSAG